jgi:hypothetical protein
MAEVECAAVVGRNDRALEPVHEQRDVVEPIPHGWHADREDVQAEEEVFPKRAVPYRVAQIGGPIPAALVERGDQP